MDECALRASATASLVSTISWRLAAWRLLHKRLRVSLLRMMLHLLLWRGLPDDGCRTRWRSPSSATRSECLPAQVGCNNLRLHRCGCRARDLRATSARKRLSNDSDRLWM